VAASADRPSSRNLRALRPLWPFLAPYRLRLLGAGFFLLVAAATVLGLGWALRHLIDDGLASGDAALLDRTVVALLGVVVVAALSTFGRFYLVTWLGERIVADLRRAVYARVLELNPGFYEVTRTGEIITRITTDTTLVQTVVGS
jgi:ATP-binding cassette, subfamily B, bacterial